MKAYKSNSSFRFENAHDVTVYFMLGRVESHSLLAAHGKICASTIDAVDTIGLHIQMCYDVTSKYVCEYNRCG